MKKAAFIPFLAILVLAFQTNTNAQSGKAPVKAPRPTIPAVAMPAAAPDPTLLNISGENISRSEFERVYRKNNRDSIYTEKAIREYLDLYINYKLKVKEAESLKMDTSEAFKTELAGYRKQLAQPYLTDKDVSESLVKEAYDRLSKDVHASHILLKLNADALPKDTLAVYNRIMKIRDQIMKGVDFGKIARDSSEDPSAKENNGDLGYFTGMQMVYPFESAAYTTKIGQVSMPVRTRFGYHLIKVVDMRDAQGEVHVAHIMIRLPKDAPDSTLKNADKQIHEAYAALKSGMLWDTAVVKFSEDKGSVKRGGELPWFGTGKMVPEFEKAAFQLKNDGDYSDIVKTSYGYHIIRRLERRGVASFDEKKGELKQMISRDSRNEASKLSMVNKIKKEYKFKEITKNRDEFVMILDTTVANGDWDLNKAEKFNKTLFTLTDSLSGNTAYTQQDFAKYVSTHQTKRTGTNPQAIGNGMYTDWVADQCLSYEESKLDTKYPDFRNLMKEYRDGILLFDLTDKMVWSKAVKDTTGLQTYYDKNKNNYLWGERCEATIYTVANEKVADNLRKQLNKGKKSVDDILTDINKQTPNAITKKDAIFNHGESEVIEKSGWKTGISDNISRNGQLYIVNLKKIIPVGPKTLDEAKGVITADYQSYLETEWIKGLREKYPVQVNQQILPTLWTK
ncbi:peptidylprolyl isomerase [soil metagenome]